MNSQKIMIVDDCGEILEPITLLLRGAKYNVQPILKGSDIVSRMESCQPDLLLLDVLMSGMDGRDICTQLKNNPNVKHIPIIMMSAHNDLKQLAEKAGADDFIVKPFDIGDLLKKIENLIKIVG